MVIVKIKYFNDDQVSEMYFKDIQSLLLLSIPEITCKNNKEWFYLQLRNNEQMNTLDKLLFLVAGIKLKTSYMNMVKLWTLTFKVTFHG